MTSIILIFAALFVVIWIVAASTGLLEDPKGDD